MESSVTNTFLECSKLLRANVARKQWYIEVFVLFLNMSGQTAVAVEFFAAYLTCQGWPNLQIAILVDIIQNRRIRIRLDFLPSDKHLVFGVALVAAFVL